MIFPEARAISFRRGKGLLAVLGSVLGVMLCLNALCLALGGLDPQWLKPETPLNLKRHAYLGGKVAGVEKAERSGRSDPREPLAIFVGQSTVRWGVETERIAARDGRDVRWLQLAGQGISIEQLEFFLRPLLASRLKPALAVLGFHLGWLVGNKKPPKPFKAAPADLLQALRAGEWRSARRIARRWLWVLKHKRKISAWIHRAFLECRARLFWRRPGLGIEADFRPDPDPWKSDGPEASTPLHVPERKLKRWMDLFQTFGWFDSKRYATRKPSPSPSARSLRRVLRKLQGTGAAVVIVLMPERKMLREAIPPEALPCLRELLREAFGAQAPEVVNLRAALPDELFYDVCHLNRNGRAVYSDLLAKKLGPSVRAVVEKRRPAH